MAIPKSTNRAAITYAPSLDVLQRLATLYVGKPVTLACSGCEAEVYCGLYESGPAAEQEKEDCILALFQHTAFEHATRHDVVLVRTTVELVWEA